MASDRPRRESIFLDMDGTVLNGEHELTPYTIQVLRATGDLHNLYVCSGRSIHLLRAFLKQMAVERPVITNNGAAIHTPNRDLPIWKQPLPTELAEELVDLCWKERLGLCLFTEAGVALPVWSGRYRRYEIYNELADRTGVRHIPVLRALSREALRAVCRETEVIHGSVLYLGQNDLAALHTFLARHSGLLEMAQSAPQIVDVTVAGVNKWEALKKLCGLQGISPDTIYYFGNDENDTCVFQHCRGHTVAVENVCEEALSAAEHICPPNTKDGVAQWLERRFLK